MRPTLFPPLRRDDTLVLSVAEWIVPSSKTKCRGTTLARYVPCSADTYPIWLPFCCAASILLIPSQRSVSRLTLPFYTPQQTQGSPNSRRLTPPHSTFAPFTASFRGSIPQNPLDLNSFYLFPVLLDRDVTLWYYAFANLNRSAPMPRRLALPTQTDALSSSSVFSITCALICAMERSQTLSHQALPDSFPWNGGCGDAPSLATQRCFALFALGYPLSCHTNANCPFCNSFLLITIRIAGGVGISPTCARPKVLL